MEFEVFAKVDTPTHTVVVAEIRNAEAFVPLESLKYGSGVNEEWFRTNAPPRPRPPQPATSDTTEGGH